MTAAENQTQHVLHNNKSLEVLHASIGGSTSGDNELVAAVAASKICVLSMFFQVAASVNGYLHDSDSNDLVGDSTNVLTWSPLTVGGAKFEENIHGWFKTASGESLELNLSGAVIFGGCISYILIPDGA